MSIQRRALTSKGVKPIVPYQHRFANFYLFGAYSPIDGTHCTLELPACNHICFQCFLDYFSKQQPEEFKILVLDNGALHKAKELLVPSNIALLFIPPYSPELNPAEKIWRYLKDHLANQIFHNLDTLSNKVATLINQLDNPIIKSLTHNKLYTLNFMHIFDV
jgi:transposase